VACASRASPRRRVRSGCGIRQAGRRQAGGAARDDRSQADPRPFSGNPWIRQVNLGQYLNAGRPCRVAPVAESDLRELRCTPAGDRALERGARVLVTAEAAANTELTGKITAIDSIVDQGTRNIQIQATLANPKASSVPHVREDARDPGRFASRRGGSRISHQLRALRRLGLRRRRPQRTRRQELQGRAAAIRQAGPAARRPGRRRLRGRSGQRDRHLRRLQAPQRRRHPGQQRDPAGEQPRPRPEDN